MVIHHSIGLHKRSECALSTKSAENKRFPCENPSNSRISRRKRIRKTSQHSHFSIYRDETSSPSSYSSDSYRGSSPVHSALETERVRPKIVVEIPFRPEIHQNPGPLSLLEPLQPTSTNRGPRTRPIPKKWSKK